MGIIDNYNITKITPTRDKLINFVNKSALEVLLLLSFILGFVLEVLLYIRYTIDFYILYDGFIFLFNAFYLALILLIAISFLISIYQQLKNPLKKSYTIMIFLILSVFFLNLSFVIVLIKNTQGITLTVFDVLLFYVIFSIGVMILGVSFFAQIMLKYRKAEIQNPSSMVKISSISVGIVVICSAVLLINTSIIIFSGNVSEGLIQYSGVAILEVDPLSILRNVLILVGAIVIALVLFVIPRTRIWERF